MSTGSLGIVPWRAVLTRQFHRRRSSEQEEQPEKVRRMSGVGERGRRDESSKRLSGSGIEEESERAYRQQEKKNRLFYLFLVFALVWPCAIIVFLVSFPTRVLQLVFPVVLNALYPLR